VKIAERQQGFDTLVPRFADSDQDAGRERDALLPGRPDRGEARGGVLIRRSEMRSGALTDTVEIMPPETFRQN
jgi:hypothetical protein